MSGNTKKSVCCRKGTRNVSISSFIKFSRQLQSSPHGAITAVFNPSVAQLQRFMKLCLPFSLFLSRLGRLSASTSSPILPAPMLDIYSRSKDSVALVCRVPEGHLGVHFMLYRQTEKVFFLFLSEVFSSTSGLLWFLFFSPLLI